MLRTCGLRQTSTETSCCYCWISLLPNDQHGRSRGQAREHRARRKMTMITAQCTAIECGSHFVLLTRALLLAFDDNCWASRCSRPLARVLNYTTGTVAICAHRTAQGLLARVLATRSVCVGHPFSGTSFAHSTCPHHGFNVISTSYTWTKFRKHDTLPLPVQMPF